MKNISFLPATLVLLLSCFLHGDAGVKTALSRGEALTGEKLDGPTEELFFRMYDYDDQATADCAQAYLNAGVSPNLKIGKRTLLGWAVLWKKVLTVRVLLEHGADANAVDGYGYSTLSWLLSTWHYDKNVNSERDMTLLVLLCQNGANVNQCDKAGKTLIMQVLLHSVTLESWADPVFYLIKHGADLNIQDHEGRTALMMAADTCFDNIQLLETFVKAGARLNIQDKSGKTALIISAARELVGRGLKNNLTWLLCAGADPLIKDASGKTALAYFLEMDAPREPFQASSGVRVDGCDALRHEPTFRDVWRELLVKACEFHARYGESVAVEKIKECENMQYKKYCQDREAYIYQGIAQW